MSDIFTGKYKQIIDSWTPNSVFPITTETEYVETINLIGILDREYYENNTSVVDDAIYDAIFTALLEYEAANPDTVKNYSPTKVVGGANGKQFDTVSRYTSMRSILSITKNLPEELTKFIAFVENKNNGKPVDLVLEPKYDGIALDITYVNGLLSSVSTRGDGRVGEDVTQNYWLLNNVPMYLCESTEVYNSPEWKYKYHGMILSVRGEVVALKSVLAKRKNDIEVVTGKVYATPRHAASALMRRFYRPEQKSLAFVLEFIPYDYYRTPTHYDYINNSLLTKTYSEKLLILAKLGFKIQVLVDKIPENVKLGIVRVFSSRDGRGEMNNGTVMYAHSVLESVRDSLDYDIDGIVVKVNDVDIATRCGGTDRYSSWMLALKFSAKQAETKVIDICGMVAKSGRVTPVAKLEPVVITNTVITKCNLKNYNEVLKNDIRIGDTVYITRAGDTIPEISGVKLDDREYKLYKPIKFIPPSSCPECGGTLSKHKSYLYCNNTTGCRSQIVKTLTHWFSTIHTYGSPGEQLCAFLVDNFEITKIADIYDKELLAKLEKALNEKEVTKFQYIVLSTALNVKMSVSLYSVFLGLNIRHIGMVNIGVLTDAVRGYCLEHFDTGGAYENILKFVEHNKANPAELTKLIGIEAYKAFIAYFTSDLGVSNLDAITKTFMIDLSW